MLSAARSVCAALILAVPGAAFASSEEAWDEFAKEVEEKCTEAASDIFRRPQIAVDPTGTEKYGVAIVYGRVKGGGKDRAAVICVLDKRSGQVELGSELGQDVVRVRRPKQEGADDTTNKAENKRNSRKQNQQEDMQDNGGNTGGDDLDMGDE